MTLGRAMRSGAPTAILTLGATAFAVDFGLSRQSTDAGGMMHSTGGDLELSGTIGQPDAGFLTGSDFTLAGGFWFPVAPGDCDEDGLVGLNDHTALAECLTGPPAASDDPLDGTCRCFDTDRNGAVDLADFRRIQTEFTGP